MTSHVCGLIAPDSVTRDTWILSARYFLSVTDEMSMSGFKGAKYLRFAACAIIGHYPGYYMYKRSFRLLRLLS